MISSLLISQLHPLLSVICTLVSGTTSPGTNMGAWVTEAHFSEAQRGVINSLCVSSSHHVWELFPAFLKAWCSFTFSARPESPSPKEPELSSMFLRV